MTTAATRSRSRLRGLAFTTLLLSLLAALTAAPGQARTFQLAQAAPALAGASCPGELENPFLRWVDPAQYTLASGGDFEGQLAWTGSRGVKTVTGNEPFKVHRSTDGRSLYLPGGASVLSPPLCAGVGEPTVRFFAVGSGQLKLEVVYETLLGSTSTTVATLSGMRSWGPSLPLPFLANVLGLTSLDGLTTSVRFRLTAVGRTSWQIDDFYVDPWKVD